MNTEQAGRWTKTILQSTSICSFFYLLHVLAFSPSSGSWHQYVIKTYSSTQFTIKIHLLYSCFWLIPFCLNFMYRRFGTLCSIFIGGVSRKNLLSACSNPAVLVASVVPLNWNLLVKERVENDIAWQTSAVNKHGVTGIRRCKTWGNCCVFGARLNKKKQAQMSR